MWGFVNPLTSQVHIFPDIKFKEGYCPVYMLGYDCVEDVYKVLAVDQRGQHKVAVLGRGG